MQNSFSMGSFIPVANPRLQLVEAAALKASQDKERRILDEIANPPAGLLGKKVWQMTREAWESIHSPITKAYTISIGFGIEAGDLFLKLHGYTHNGYEFGPDGQESNSRHEVQVAYALLRGDSVPPEVLIQYPKGSWEKSDLRRFRHLPMYITTRAECLAAIAEWDKMASIANETLEAKSFNYQSERDIRFLLKAYWRIWNELLALMDALVAEDSFDEAI